MAKNDATIRGFAFTEEDLAVLKRLQDRLEREIGKMSQTQVVRWALRQAEKTA